MSNLPKTYRAGVIEGPGQELKIVERELKQPSENQVLVKMVASSICYSDHYTLEVSLCRSRKRARQLADTAPRTHLFRKGRSRSPGR